MTPEERTLLNDLFDRIDKAPVGPLDADADALIRDRIGRNPAAPYAMAQTIAIQNQLLEKADARIRALEAGAAAAPAAVPADRPTSSAWNVPGRAPAGMGAEAEAAFADGRPAQRTSVPAMGARPLAGGGGFLAGAGQVALGVAGGVLLGSAIGSLLSDPAEAAPVEPAAEPPADEAATNMDPGVDDGGFEDDGGFFDGGFGE